MKKIKERPQSVEVEGNKGGSYIILRKSEREGWCFLEVGETCVRTMSEEVPVAWLAVVLTIAKDKGFESIVRDYGASDEWIKTVSK